MKPILRTLPVLAMLATAACSNLNTIEERTLTGGAIGAGGGLAIGALAGGPLAGAIIGAIGGAAIGGLTAEEQVKVDPRAPTGAPAPLGQQPARP
ncbi:MAG: hypothetical protein HY521_01105 [Proteobacteria bacterium]|nr:hypothetical protein [Pseudomonadota bacterium]